MEKILRGEAIKLFAIGKMFLDFTYIDDIVAALMTIVATPSKDGLHEIRNLGKLIRHSGIFKDYRNFVTFRKMT